MPTITIYTTALCPYCFMAKQLLKNKNAQYEEIDVGGKPDLRQKMTEMAGGRHTVPQIWIGNTHVGGCDELMALNRSGRLDEMLTANSA